MNENSNGARWPKGRLVAHPVPGKVWVEVPHRNDVGSDWIEADDFASTDSTTWERNRRTLIHEATTPMRGHDADGTCCLRAQLTPLPPAATERETGR